MNAPLRVLHLEDDFRDAELVRAILEEEGISTELTRVEDRTGFCCNGQPWKLRPHPRRLHAAFL